MKIVIEKIGDNVGVSFIGKGQRIDRLMLLTVVLIETFVDSLIPGSDGRTAAAGS